MIEAIVLVGGEGRRLRPLTDTRPKPMMPLVDRPFVAHQLDHLRRFGVTDVVFSCGYRPEALEAHFGDGAAVGMRLRYVVDPVPLGTAGAIKNAQPALAGERVIVLNGDVLTDLDLAALVDQHRRTGAEGTVALTPVEDPSPWGLVRLRPDRGVLAFVEKPRPAELVPGEPFLINAGTYLLERRLIDRIPPATPCSIEREVFPVVAADGALYGFPADAYWRDIGTPASYLQAHVDVLSGAVRTESPTGDRYLGPGAVLEVGAQVGGHASLGARVAVAAGARVEQSVLGEGTSVGAGAMLDRAVVGSLVAIGRDCLLADGVVVGDGARIADGVRLEGPVVVQTGETIGGGE